MINLNIKFVPMSYFEKRGLTTIGYWKVKNKTGHIIIGNMSNWKYEAAVLIHELIEYFYCKAFNVTTKICDDWDYWYEEQYRIGKIPKSKEPGDDKRAPYYAGHQLGNKFERMTIFILGCSWEKYLKECDRLMKIYE